MREAGIEAGIPKDGMIILDHQWTRVKAPPKDSKDAHLVYFWEKKSKMDRVASDDKVVSVRFQFV